MGFMKLISIFFLLFFVHGCTTPEKTSKETNDKWYLKWNKDSTAYCYEDVNGNIMIDPIYWG